MTMKLVDLKPRTLKVTFKVAFVDAHFLSNISNIISPFLEWDTSLGLSLLVDCIFFVVAWRLPPHFR